MNRSRIPPAEEVPDVRFFATLGSGDFAAIGEGDWVVAETTGRGTLLNGNRHAGEAEGHVAETLRALGHD